MKSCPFCAEQIQDEASKCRFCGSVLQAPPPIALEQTFVPDVGGGMLLLGRYRLLDELGRGGMAVVYRARDERLDRAVAIKTIPETVYSDPRYRKALEREARLAMDLRHERIRAVHNMDEDPAVRVAFLVMECLEGVSVDHVLALRPDERLAEAEARAIGVQACEALEYAHRKGVVHRDLKPKNLFLEGIAGDQRTPLAPERISLRVVDFGIGSCVRESVMSQTGMDPGASGTLHYMPPEQVLGEPPAPAMDVYALGATLYEIVAGHPPFHRGDIREQIYKVAPRPIESISPGLWAAIAACLEKEPGRRPSMSELRSMLDGTAAAPRPPAPAPSAAAPAAVVTGGLDERCRRAGLRIVKPGERWYPRQPTERQAAEAEKLGLPLAIEHKLTGIVLALIPGGEFWMGASPGDPEAAEFERPRHRVRLEAFYIGVAAVTQEQWEKVMGASPGRTRGPGLPADGLSWEDAQDFLRRAARAAPEPHLRMPSEAEWERAARGEKDTSYWWGAAFAKGMTACNEAEAGGAPSAKPALSGRYPFNPFGLYDVLGNAWEWVEDTWHPSYAGAPADGRAWEPFGTGSRVARGGAWNSPPRLLRVSNRFQIGPKLRIHVTGLRCARDARI